MKSQLDRFESGLTNQGTSSAGGVTTDLASLLRGYIFRTSPCPCNKMESVLLVCLLLLYSIPSPHQLQLTPEGTSMCVHACVSGLHEYILYIWVCTHVMHTSVCVCVCVSVIVRSCVSESVCTSTCIARVVCTPMSAYEVFMYLGMCVCLRIYTMQGLHKTCLSGSKPCVYPPLLS